MKHWLLYILASICTLMLFSCSEDDREQDVYADEPLEIAVSTKWQCGRSIGSTRAIDNPLGTLDSDGNSLQFPDALYPDWLHITLTDGTATVASYSPLPDKFLVKKTFEANDNYETQKYIAYHDVYSLDAYKDVGAKEHKPFYSKSKIQKLTVEANTLSQRFPVGNIPQAWDDDDVKSFGNIDHLTTGGAARDEYDLHFHGRYRIERNHLFLDLGHATALLRLYFKVAEDYDKVRKIVLRKVRITKVGGTDLNPAHEFTLNASQSIDSSIDDPASTTEDESLGFLLTQNAQLYAYGYMKPSHSWNGEEALSSITWTGAVSATTFITMECTYDIYENDIVGKELNADLSTHCTRRNVTATNAFTFSKLKDSNDSNVSKIQAGHYYDLYITINPDYLYVLSEHDNKHIVIN